MKKLMLLISFLVLFLMACDTTAMREPVDPNQTESVLITVPSGATTTSIGKILMAEDLIQSENVFKIASKELGADGKMKAGDYRLSQAMSTDEIIEILLEGRVERNTFTFTIPEGFEIRQIVDRLESLGVINRELFMDALVSGDYDYEFLEDPSNLEGYLFPDTYEMSVGASEKEIINRMLSRFDEVFTEAYYERTEALGLTVNQLVTLASIVEREAQAKEEFPIVASVFHNRIESGMMLQSCATVQFILGERKERLSYDDIAIESPFNTYINNGLPPSPIASPGKLALESALYPDETDYLYFVVKKGGNGTHVFSETLDQHNKAKEENR